MAGQQVRVIAHAGHRGEESPRAFFIGGRRIEVERVLRRWIEEAAGSRCRRRCFDVRGSDSRRHLLIFDEELDTWFYL